MGHVEIYETYQDLSQNEAFEVFENNHVEIDDIEGLLGKDVADSYLSWTYMEIK